MPNNQHQRLRPAWQAVLGDTRNLVTALVGSGSKQPSERGPADWVDSLVTDLLHLAAALLVTGDRVAQVLPGYKATTTELQRVENALLRGLRHRIDLATTTVHEADVHTARARLLNQLLTDSLESNAGLSREALHLRILRSMMPDEARILAAMSDGTRFPLLHIETRPPGPRTVLANACTVGRAAGVHVQEAVPTYITHLRNLGLLDEGPKEDALSDQYALLANEDYVMYALEEGRGGLRGVAEVRRTIRISKLGAELWAACRAEAAEESSDTTRDGVVYLSAYAGAPPQPDKGSKQ